MKKLLVLAVLLGASFSTLTFASHNENENGRDKTAYKTTVAISETGDVASGSDNKWTEKKARIEEKKAELKAKQEQKREEITKRHAVKVGARAERLRNIIGKINNGFLTSLLTQIDHLADKAKTDDAKAMIMDIKLLIQDQLGLLNVDADGNVVDETTTDETVTEDTTVTDDEDENENDNEDENETEEDANNNTGTVDTGATAE